ncbi:Lecithin-cholesterol acyltransferase-like 1 [Bienertia sinuspersici]
MAPLVQSLEEIGYVDNKTLFGAPYDFRYGLAPQGHPCHVGSKYLQDLKHLIETASALNGGKPVILLSHSLGGLFVHQLLLRNTLSWRQKFIKHFIALSTPWAGTVQEMLTFASGYTLGVPLVKPLLVRQEQRSSESNLWLMPCPNIFGHVRPLVITPNGNYTAKDIPKFLNDIGFSEGVSPYKTRIIPLVEELKAPQVPITCIIGSGVDTPETLFYDHRGFDKQPSIIWGDGDGTVNSLSLLAVQSEWMKEKNQQLKMVRIKGVSHTDVLSDQRSLDQILSVVSDVNSDVLVVRSALVNDKERVANNKIATL